MMQIKMSTSVIFPYKMRHRKLLNFWIEKAFGHILYKSRKLTMKNGDLHLTECIEDANIFQIGKIKMKNVTVHSKVKKNFSKYHFSTIFNGEMLRKSS